MDTVSVGEATFEITFYIGLEHHVSSYANTFNQPIIKYNKLHLYGGLPVLLTRNFGKVFIATSKY